MEIGIGTSAEKDPIQAAREAARRANANFNSAKIDLAIVFSSPDLSCPALLKTITHTLGNVPIVGASGGAIITQQGILKHGLTIILLNFPEDVYFNSACVQQIKAKTSLNAGRELADKLLYAFHGVRRDIGIIFADGLIQENSNLIYGLQEKLGRSFPLAGASASDNLRFSKTYLYFNEEVLSDAACGMLLGGRINFGLGIKHGWKPLGKPRYVTRSYGNVVSEIDNAPAANIYKEYLACDFNKLIRELKHISVLYPIGIYLSGEEEYLLRNVVFAQDDGALIFQGDVPEGSQIRLMIGNKECCLDAARQAVEEAKKDLSTQTRGIVKTAPKSFALVFDSISRYKLLSRDAHKELEIIREGLGGNVPIVGLYTYGEQAPLRAVSYRGQTHFHNQTIVVLIIEG